VSQLEKSKNKWCGGRESNPHSPYGPRDFKSLASTSSATPASGKKRSRNFNSFYGSENCGQPFLASATSPPNECITKSRDNFRVYP
jgi:hypothetical protein